MAKKKTKNGREKDSLGSRRNKKDLEWISEGEEAFDSWSSRQGSKVTKVKLQNGSVKSKLKRTHPVRQALENFPKDVAADESPYQSRRLLVRQIMNLELQNQKKDWEEQSAVSEADSWTAAEEKFSQIYEPLPFSVRMSELRKLTREDLLLQVKSDRLRSEFVKLSRSDILKRIESMKRNRGGEPDYSIMSRSSGRNENIYQSVSVMSSSSQRGRGRKDSPIYENTNMPKRSSSFLGIKVKKSEEKREVETKKVPKERQSVNEIGAVVHADVTDFSSSDEKDPPYISRAEIIRRASMKEVEANKPVLMPKKTEDRIKSDKKVTVKNEPTYISRSTVLSSSNNNRGLVGGDRGNDASLKEDFCDTCSECSCSTCESEGTAVGNNKGSYDVTSLRSTPEPVPLTEVKLRKLEFEKQKLLRIQSQGVWSKPELETIYEPVPASIVRTEMEIKELRKHLGNSEKLIDAITRIETIKRRKLIKELRSKLLESLDAKGDPQLMAKKQEELRELLKKALDSSIETMSNVSLGLIYVPMEENTETGNSSAAASFDDLVGSDTFASIDSLIFEPRQGKAADIDKVQKVIENQFQYLDAQTSAGSESEGCHSLDTAKSVEGGENVSDTESITSFNSVIYQGEKLLQEVETVEVKEDEQDSDGYEKMDVKNKTSVQTSAFSNDHNQYGPVSAVSQHGDPSMEHVKDMENQTIFRSHRTEDKHRESNVSPPPCEPHRESVHADYSSDNGGESRTDATGTDCKDSDTSWDFQRGKTGSEGEDCDLSDHVSLSEQFRESLKIYEVGNLRKKPQPSVNDPLGSVFNLLPKSEDLGTISTIKKSGMTTFREITETLYSGNAQKMLVNSSESLSSEKSSTFVTSRSNSRLTIQDSRADTPNQFDNGELQMYCSKNGEALYGAHNSSFLFTEYAKKSSLYDTSIATFVLRHGKTVALSEEVFRDTLKKNPEKGEQQARELKSAPQFIPPPPPPEPPSSDLGGGSVGKVDVQIVPKKAPQFGSGKRESVIKELKMKLKQRFNDDELDSKDSNEKSVTSSEISKELADLRQSVSRVATKREEFAQKFLSNKPAVLTESSAAKENNLKNSDTRVEKEVNPVAVGSKLSNIATQTSGSLYESSSSVYDTHESSDALDDIVAPLPLTGIYDVPRSSIHLGQRFSPDGQSVPRSWPAGFDDRSSQLSIASGGYPHLLIQDPQSLDITDFQCISANPYQYLSPLEMHHYRRLLRQQQELALRAKVYPKEKRNRRKQTDPNLSWSDIESIIFAEQEQNMMLASGIIPPSQSTRMMAYKDDWIFWDQLQRRRISVSPAERKRWEDEKTKRMLLWIHQHQSLQQHMQPFWWLAKQRASLRWLVSIAYDHKPPDDVRDPFYVSGDEQENIKPSVVHALANAELYCLALAHIYADPNYSQLNHWGVIQALARKGVYVAEPSDVALTETTLIQSSPLRMSAHMAVTEAIMTLYIKEVVTGDRIANAVRRLRDVSKSSIGGQSAHDVEEALVIWINQSCSALTQMIADSKVAEGRVEFPGPVELADLSDGIGICALIACYCPDAFDWSQIAVNEPISVADSLNNLQLMQRFCRESLPYDVCHLTLEDMLYMHGSVKQNVIAFLADLFYLFEVRPAKCVKVPGMAVEKSHEDGAQSWQLIYPDWWWSCCHENPVSKCQQCKKPTFEQAWTKTSASTVTPGTKVATTQPIARRFQQSSISIELPAKPDEPRSSNRQSDNFTQQQQRQPEPEPAEEFVVHKGRNVPTLNAVSRSTKQQQHIVFNSSDDDRNNYHAPMAGMPSNWDDRRSSGAGRRSRRNSITEVESHLTIENFGGSQENLSMFSRNPDKEQAVHTGRRQMDFETNLSSRSASINYGSGSSSRASDFPEYQATPGSVTRSSSRLQDVDSRGAPPSRLSQRSDEVDDRYRYQDANRGRESRFYDEIEYVERPRRPESRGQFQQREPEPEYVERPRRPESRGQYQSRDIEFEERPRRSESRGPSYGRHEEQRDYEERPRRPESRGAGNHFEDYVDRSRRSESRGPYGGRDEQRDYEDRSRRVSNYQRDDDYEVESRPKRPESRGMYVSRPDGQRDFRDASEPQRLRDESREPQPIVIIADPQSIGSNPVDAVAKLSRATNFAELSKLRDNLGNQGLSIVYMQNDTENMQKREKRVSVEKERPKSLFVTSQGIDGDGDDGPAQAELLSVRLKMEEKRRLIEAEKKKAEVLASKQRQTVGKAAFLQAVSKGRSERGSPDSGGGESMADVEYRSTMVSDGTDRLRSMEEIEERDHRWLQDVARSRSCVQTPDYVPDVYNEQFYLHQQAQRRTWGQPQPIPVGYGYAPMESQPMGYGQPSPVRRAQWGQPQPVRPMVMQHQYYQQPQPAFSVPQPSVYDSPQQELFPVYQAQSRQSMNAPFRLHDDVERPQSIANGPRENKNSINHDVNRSAFTLPRQGDDSGSRFLPIRRSEERESPVLMRSRHSSTQDVRKERPASATSQGSGGHSIGIHTQLPAPSVDDMEPQSISFIEMPTTTDDVDIEVPQRIQRLNLSSGSRTYRVSDSGKSPPRPSLSRSFFQAQQSNQKEPTSPRETPERDLEEELANEVKLAKLKEGVDADQGFMITFDDSPKPRRPKPQLGARKNSSTTSTTTTTKSSTPETLASPITPQKVEPVTPKRQSLSSLIRLKSDVHERSPSPTSSPSLNREVQQITESFQTQVSIPNGSGESRLSGQNGLGFVIDSKEDTADTSTLDDMEKKKEMLLLKSMKRKQEIEEAKRQKELEAQIKKEEEAAKEEEKARKREEEKARRAAIFEQYKLKKAIEEAEKEGRTIDMPEPVSARQTVKLRSKPTPAKPRPKTIHVDNSDLGSKSRPGSTTHLTEPGPTVKRSEGSKGSNTSLSGSSAARRGSNSSLHADSLPREMGRRIEVHSGRKQSATLAQSRIPSNVKKKETLSRGGSLKEKSSKGIFFGRSGGSDKNVRPGSRQGTSGIPSRRFGSLMNLSGASNNNENDYDGNTTARTPVKRAPSPGMGNTMRTRTIQSPSGPGSLPHGLVKQRSNLMDDNASDAGSTASSEYIGPRLFKQPTAKSNRSIILNAVEYCIFPGAVNRQSKQQVLEEIARSEAKHFLVLFRDAGSQFRALYEYFPESEEVIKVWGNGPKQVTGNMFEKFFKYNSGGKCFSQVHTKTLTVTIDAFTIHSSLWSGKRHPYQTGRI